ncbi:TIMELESS-interacting protein [Xenentodon cancila]
MLDLQENSRSDIPNFDGSEDEAFPPLPPPESPGQQGDQDDGRLFTGEDGEMSKLADVPAAKRKGVKRPQPKLDSQRLISERGLPALRSLFDNVRFKGKGHEAEDLRLLMQKMENWAHRLYPRLQFEDFMDKVEKLGSKKEVQTCLKRIRLDMPLMHEDFMDKDDEAPPELQVFGDPDPFTTDSFVDGSQKLVHSTPAPTTPAAPSLTEEQCRRMELNRQRALERRLARQQQQQTDSSNFQSVHTPSLRNQPTSVSSVNALNNSIVQGERMEGLDLDLELAGSSTQELSQPPPTGLEGDPEPAPEAPPTGPEPAPEAPPTGPEPAPEAPPTGPEPAPEAPPTDPEHIAEH